MIDLAESDEWLPALGQYTSRFAWAVAANPTIAASEPDAASLEGDIPYVITTVWDDLAGVEEQDLQPPPVVIE